jgi:hypothetical protein
MMQKRSTLSLLLISFILVFAFSLSAQQVTVESKNAARCASSVLDVTVDNLSDAGAIEVVLEVTGTGGSFFDAMNVTWNLPAGVLTNQIVDLSGVDNVSPDTVRIAAITDGSGAAACLAAGNSVVAQISFTTNDNCAGTIEVAGGTFTCPSFDVSTQFSDCDGLAVTPAVVNAGTVTVINQDPTIDPIADASLPWGDAYVGNAVGDDLDLANGCEALTYSVVSGPAGLTVNATTGTINWVTTGADVCTHTVEIQVEDACGASASTSFEICVTNEAPTITCPDDTLIALGDEFTGMVMGADADGGPSPLLYSLIDDGGAPGSPSLNAATGEFTWQTDFDEAYKGAFTFGVAVTDGANVCDPCSPANADTCYFTVTVVNFLITIEKSHNSLQGQQQSLDVYMQNSGFENYPMGGFDFLFQYDATALTFQSADPGQFLEDCGWEYFTYRYGPNGNCGTGCPSGEVRVTAIAETNNGQGNHPDCFTNGDPGVSNQLVVLNFLVTNDRTFECMYAPVRFFWYDCGDNTISSVDGNYLFISNHVYNFEDTTGSYSYDLADPSQEFPTAAGANYTCDVAIDDDKPDPLRFIDFVNGGVDIVCADSIDARGDLNLNEIAYEIADAVLYSNYFVYGLSVFTVNEAGQIAASDVNADGITLSVADLVYTIRVLVGDANPYPKEVVNSPEYVNATYEHHNGVISVDDIEVAAAHVVLSGNVTPTLLADNMTMIADFDGANTRVLVYSIDGNSFTGNMLNVGNAEIVSLDMADALGTQVVAKWIPSEFALSQNYPNPFNPTTTVSFQLPAPSDVTLTIYNVNGQKVTEFSGSYETGAHSIEWDASASASGIYFYRLSAGNFTDVKKMVLLK